MNRYEKYLDMIEFTNVILSGSDSLIKDYHRKKDIQDKIYFYTELRNSLIKIINTKSKEKNKYSDNDIEFLKQFSGFNLTLDEACLVEKTNEYYYYLRLISEKMGKTSKKLDDLIEEDIEKLHGDYTPKLIWSFYEKHKKGNKN